MFSRHDRFREKEVDDEPVTGRPGTHTPILLPALRQADLLHWEVSLTRQSLGKAALSQQLTVVLLA